MQRKDFDELQARVEWLENVVKAVGLPASPWVSPNGAADLLSVSKTIITTEIDKAEHARTHSLKYDVLYGTHYRKKGAHWQLNAMELEKVIFLPPDQRPFIDLSA
ncbi:MAG: hypothetical protein AAGA83_18215 [Cyanobacteria bacterium P01_F01_bin.116]